MLLALALALPATAAEFSGQVVHYITGAAVPSASVFLEDHNSDGQQPITQTDARGSFRFDSDAPFALRIEHPDYELLREVARTNPAQPLRLEMISKTGTSLTAEERTLLAQFASQDGRALFLFPYILQSEIPRFDELLEFNLDMAINTQLQTLGEDIVTVQRLPATLNQQGNRTLLYGKALKALALVSGVSGSRPNGNVTLRSRYRIVPGGQGVIFVSDEFEPDEVAAAAFDEELSELWGQSTFLSIAYRDFEEASAANPVDTEVLRRTRDALVSFRRDLPDANSLVARQAGKLLDAISERLQP
jgi:hypothetical protein